MEINTNSEKIAGIMSRGVFEAVDRRELENWRPGKNYASLGIDPTAPIGTSGACVVLRKLRHLQDLDTKRF